MFVNPEYYFETEVTDKNPDNILKFIRKMQRDINKQKRVLESPEFSEETMYIPGPEDYIWFDRECIVAAKKALAELGIEYIPARQERADDDFQKNIGFLKQIRFEMGGFINERINYTIDICDDKISIKYSTQFGLQIEEIDVPEDWGDIGDFFEYLKDIHFGEWHRHYNISRWKAIVSDGTQWSLIFSYSNGHMNNRYTGDNDYPYNFSRLTEPLGIEWKRMERER